MSVTEKEVGSQNVTEFKNDNSSNSTIPLMDVEDQSSESLNEKDMLGLEGDDYVLAKKMSLVNDALDEIGFTPYHLKLFFLNGMGYSTDSQLTMLQSTVDTYINYQFKQGFSSSTVSLYVGLLVGAIVWGFSADLIGRKIAFNTSLFLSAVFSFLAGTMGNYGTYCLFVALSAAACGGNLVLDTTVFLEFLPHNKHWMVTFFAFWWGIGQTVAVAIAWPFLVHYSCSDTDNCLSGDNHGWRYTWFVNSAIVLILAIARVTVVRLEETPKFLISNKRDVECIRNLHRIADKYGRSCSLTLEKLEACGRIKSNDSFKNAHSMAEVYDLVKGHIKVLFANKTIARSTSLVILSWTLLGIAYPLYSNFLPVYLESRSAAVGSTSVNETYRNNVITNAFSTLGPILGALLLMIPRVGHRGCMAIGGISSMALFFGYTAVRTELQNVALSSASYITMFTYYGCLYAYTPEVLPSSARGTGNAIAIACTRLMGAIVPVIAYFANTSTSIPIWICGAAIGIIGFAALFFPFDPSTKRVV
ncbi:hypothetical protein PACTADRAFT_56605 [Pachysolen tannophilus NRRL Y-2460]|uniref:Major facilitator superfamily (MFS) profile domain-containing protein n=1 Tax=Pachysolen tannophilus NRRL Y-2460 TaxID=669874 RepID=A0A1E4TW49_PACTA|nr:hypothetical protein PACTADRAFT_56605 [Pachysolen tannophilus NRRL Y-2460]